MQTQNISTRGENFVKAVRWDKDMLVECFKDIYHYETNQQGYMCLAIAENRLSWPQFKRKIIQVQNNVKDIPDWVLSYGDTQGYEELRHYLSKMMENSWVNAPVKPEYLGIQSGCAAILDCLGYNLANPNDSVIIPGPIYPGFKKDLEKRPQLHLEVCLTYEENNFNPQIADLEKTYQECINRNQPPKIFLICQPCNPTGLIYDEKTMNEMLDWAFSKDLHVISDEIYGNSFFPGQKVFSVAEIMYKRNPQCERYLTDKVHIVSGLSKDWGCSGFRVGWVFTHNQQLIQCVDNSGDFHSVSHLSQNLLLEIFRDEQFVPNFITENQERLQKCYEGLKDALDAVGVRLIPAQATLAAWADFSSKLSEQTFDAEIKLYKELFQKSKILFASGAHCYSSKPGFFRIIYGYPQVSEDDMLVAMRELKRRLINHFSD